MDIKNRIYEIRGSKIMLDRDLAYAINYETKVLNQLVRRNINKFETSEYFQINLEEFNVLKSQIVTSNVINRGGTRYLPYVFTKEGIRTLSSILRKENSKKIIDKILEDFDGKNELILSKKTSLNSINMGEFIQNKIYEIRGQLVMLDSDLARIYGCTNGTKTINLAVKRHANKFPERFMFQLTESEYYSLRFQFETANTKTRSLPYVFTEQGVAMLASVLRTNVADEISVKIMDAFVKMRRYISNSLIEQKYINELVLKDNKRIELLEETFNQLEVKKEHLFFEGQIYDAYSLLIKILSVAKEEIIIIDNYAGRELFDILRDVKCNIKVITKNTSEELIKKYNKQYNNVNIIKNDIFHDRFIIIDRKILYHSGSSFKDLGNKCFAINNIQDKDFLKLLLNKIKL